MALEKESVRLAPHTFRVESDGRWLVKKDDGSVVEIPVRFQNWFQMIVGGASLSKIATSLRAVRLRRRFAGLAEFLTYLNDHELLASEDVKRYVDSIRPGVSWPISLLLRSWMHEAVFFLIPREKNSPLAGPLNLSVILISLVSVASALTTPLPEQIVPIRALVFLVFAASLGRTCAALAQAAVLYVNGHRAELSLSVEPFSVSLRVFEGGDSTSLLSGGLARAARWGSVGLIAFPALVFRLFNEHMGMFALWTLLLVTSELTPFAESWWTSFLREAFTFASGSVGREHVDEKRQREVARLYKLSTVLWPIAALAIWLLTAFALHSSVGLSARGLIVAAVLLFFVISWTDDLMGTMGLWSVDNNSRNGRGLRRYWIRKPKPRELLEDESLTRAEIEALPLIRQIPIETRSRMLQNAKLINVIEGQAICRQGDRDRSLYVLLTGQMAVAKRVDRNIRRKIIALLESGSVFGEAAFFFGAARTADVVALQPSKLLMIPHNEAMKNIELEKSEELQTRIWFLQALASGSFLKNIPADAFDAMIMSGRTVRFKAGAKVVSEGEAGTSCFFIVQGKASVSQNLKKINSLKTGDAFGEIALLYPGALRTATVSADSDLLLIAIDGEKFWSLLTEHLPLAIEIERLAEERLARDEERATQQS